MPKANIKTSRFSLFFSFFIPSFLILFSIIFSFFLFVREKETELSQFEVREKSRVTLSKNHVTDIFDDVISDLQVAIEHGELKRFLESGKVEDKKSYAGELFALVKNTKKYDQARFLDETGQEIIRVNYNSGNPVIVAEDKLQFKGDRYYFTDAFELSEGEIYVSPMDLNVEGGEIERPLKPMIRIASPVFDEEGEKKGVVILNYLGVSLINILDETLDFEDGTEILLVNKDGYFLKGSSVDREWGFMFEDRKDFNLAELRPKVWDRVSDSDMDQFLTERGLLSSDTIYPFLRAQQLELDSTFSLSTSLKKFNPEDYQWKIITFVPNETLFADSQDLVISLLAINFLIILLIVLITFFIMRASYRQRTYEMTLAKFNDVLRIITKVLRHDLANFFTRINFAMELYKEDNKDVSQLEEIRLASKSGVELISQMKELEGMTKSGTSLSSYDLGTLLSEIIKAYKIPIKVQGNASILADQAIKAVFQNIINNAINHGQTDKIDVHIETNDLKVVIKFIDYGKGIPDEIKDQIFDEGFKHGETGNTGLGLYIVEQTILRYGGSIRVEDSQPKGATFVIELDAA